jgi:DNA replication ATP-dependent helicase Dna2
MRDQRGCGFGVQVDTLGNDRIFLSLTNSSASEKIEHMRSMVQAEATAQRAEFARRMSKAVENRVEEGWCLNGLGWRRCDAGDRSVAEFVMRHGNDSRLREGDYVRVSSAAGGEWVQLATIYREEADAIYLKSRGGAWDELWLGRAGADCLIDADLVDLEQTHLKALEAVFQTSIGRECILPFLEQEEETEAADFLGSLEKLEDVALNERQKDAVAECLAAPRCHLVQGPPGTGKTRAVAELVTRCVQEGERVLITAFTHRAIHHALDTVVQCLEEPERVAKIGAAVYARGSAWRSYENFRDWPMADSDEGWVAGATPFALSSRLLNVEFDRVVVDEAGQMTMPLALMAMLSGRKWFFFGDGEQLGPVLASVSPREAREWSSFRMLSRLAEVTMLNTGYRMNTALTHWPSENFYGGELEAAPGVAERRLELPLPCREEGLARALDAEQPLVWVAFNHADGTVVQEDEAVAAARLVEALVKCGISAAEIAVVVPWRKQARRIRRHLQGRIPEDVVRRCVVDTVERMQGQEREVVILSMASSDAMFLARHAEMIYQPNRLNVAVTRARTKAIVLASTMLANFQPDGVEAAEDAEVFRSLLRTAVKYDQEF